MSLCTSIPRLPRQTVAYAHCIAVLLTAICLSVATRPTWAQNGDYDYPLKDRFVATVVGTPTAFAAALTESNPLKQKRLRVFPDRETPDVLWHGRDLLYSVALQKHRAPLMFLIAGTGSGHDGSKNINMAKAFYEAGFHVVSLSSPTYPNFVIAASETGVVGHAERDARDLYRVMQLIQAQLTNKGVEINHYLMAGYSLGGFNAAFVAALDEQEQRFNFSRVLLINPPVSLYNSISILDRMIENIPGGVDNVGLFIDQLMQGLAPLYTQGIGVDVTIEDVLYGAYQVLGLKNEQLAALIGASFRLSSASLVFAADVMADYGYIKPKGLVLSRHSDLSLYDALATRLNFTDYYHEFFYPYYASLDPTLERDAFISAISLRSIDDYIRSSEKLYLMHNVDDVILAKGEIQYLRSAFGERATIYPYGGHCGNMNHRGNVAHMLSLFTPYLEQ